MAALPLEIPGSAADSPARAGVRREDATETAEEAWQPRRDGGQPPVPDSPERPAWQPRRSGDQPSTQCRPCTGRGQPRRDGGSPAMNSTEENKPGDTPRGRGFADTNPARPRGGTGHPAGAGVILRRAQGPRATAQQPRTSGGQPDPLQRKKPVVSDSPCGRGLTYRLPQTPLAHWNTPHGRGGPGLFREKPDVSDTPHGRWGSAFLGLPLHGLRNQEHPAGAGVSPPSTWVLRPSWICPAGAGVSVTLGHMDV